VADRMDVGPDGRRDTSAGVVLALLLVLVLAAFLIWAFALGGFATLAGRPAGMPGDAQPTVIAPARGP
jgi:hypothetical protein